HPFVERLIGTIRREFLDCAFFWNAVDLARKLHEFSDYYNAVSRTPLARWHHARATCRRILTYSRLAWLSRLAAALPRSLPDTNCRLNGNSLPTTSIHH